MADWKTVKLGDVADIIGGGTPDTKNDSYWGGDVPWLTPKDLSGYGSRYISKGERNISYQGLENSSAKMLPAGSVLLTSRAPIGYVAIAKTPLCTNQGFKSLILKEDANSEFFYYLLKNNVDYIQGMSSGSTFAEISGSQIKALEFKIPPLDVQKRIAGILGALDDKIEVLREQNKTLEKMAQAVFQSWFVDFDIVRAKAAGLPAADICKKYHITPDIYDLFPSAFSADNLPQGWTIGKIKNLCFDIQSGGTPQRNIKEYWCPPTIPWLSSGEVNFPIIIHTKEKISEEGLRNSSAKIWKKYTTVVAMYGATAGEATLLGIDVSANQACCALIPYKYTIYYVYLLAKANKNIYALAANGAAQQNLNKTKVSELEVIIPDAIILTCFQNLISSFFEKIIENSKQIHTLEQTRDTLLPQLLGGKLDVKNVSLSILDNRI